MQNDRKKPITEFQRRYGLDAQINPIPRNVRKKNLQTQISLCLCLSKITLSLSLRGGTVIILTRAIGAPQIESFQDRNSSTCSSTNCGKN